MKPLKSPSASVLRPHSTFVSSCRYTVEALVICIVLATCLPNSSSASNRALPVEAGSAVCSPRESGRPHEHRKRARADCDGSINLAAIKADDVPRTETVAGGEGALPTGALNSTSSASQQQPLLQEIVVSAERTEESEFNVPMSMSALRGADLLQNHLFRFQDYVNTVPGLTLVNYGAFGSQLVIRGITAGSVPINTSVATYVDETPYGVEGTYAGSGFAAPNLDTFDMKRIEVLRGPQGTLYGSNALAGLVKYVTNPPDPERFESETEVGGSSVSHGGYGFDAHGMVNLPLTPASAIRLVGYEDSYPGYIDDPSRGRADENGVHFWGGRASFLYRPHSSLSIRLNALYQERSYGDLSNEDVTSTSLIPLYGNWTQENLVGQPGRTTTQVYNATIHWDTDFAHLVSATSYMRFDPHSIWDWSKEFQPIFTAVFGVPLGAAVLNVRPADAWTQEVRLSSAAHGPLHWLTGVFFTDEHSNLFEAVYPIDVPTRTILFGYSPQLESFVIPTHYREYAGFANLDYDLTSRLDLAVGGRYSHNDQRFHETNAGLLAGAGADFNTSSSEGVLTYSGDLRWHVSPQQMIYGRIAKGFVPGGPNDVVPTITTFPRTYSSSTTTNYEIGIKSRDLWQNFTASVDAFLIDWTRIQVLATVGVYDSIANGGSARSDGFEWSLGYAPSDSLTLRLNGAYTHAYLTEPTPVSVGGLAGNHLPFVPLVQSSLIADYTRPLTGTYSASAGATWTVSSSRFADFSANGPRQEMPGYQILDLRAGLRTDRWTAMLYVKNVTNKVVINSVQPETLAGGLGPQSAVLHTPRTIGLSATVNFP